MPLHDYTIASAGRTGRIRAGLEALFDCGQAVVVRPAGGWVWAVPACRGGRQRSGVAEAGIGRGGRLTPLEAKFVRDDRLGLLAVRVLAVLMGLHALDLIQGLFSFHFIGGVLTPAGWLVGSAVEGALVLALAVVLWRHAEAAGAWLLGPARRPHRRAARFDADVEATVLRAVGLWIVLVALPGVVYWIAVMVTPARVPIPPNPMAYLAEDLAEAALGAVAFLAAPRLSAWLRRRRRTAAPTADAGR